MDKHARLPFLGLLKVSLLGVAFPLLLTSHNWAQANIEQDNRLLYAQTPAQSTPQPSKSGEVKKTNSQPPEKKQQEGEKSDEEKKQDLPWTVKAAALGVVVILYLGVLQFFPLLLLWLPAEFTIPERLLGKECKVPLGFVIWLKYRPKVLDAWVKKYIDKFDHKFQAYETVDERKDYVSLSVLLNDNPIDELTAETLRETFAQEKRVRLLIWGEGGTGKTTIACQIAKWAMMEDKDKRLTEHLMLPILIEQELRSQSGEGIKPLMEEIVGKIQEISDSEQKIVDELLVEQLLRQRRIFLIVDHFSEMSRETRDRINPELIEFAVNALVVTSRNDETFQGIDLKIKTMPFGAVKLVNFTEQYLKQRQKWHLFENEQTEFLEECNQLAKLLGDQEIIVFLAKLYAERMINIKERNLLGENRSLDNIPDLIIDHLEKLNRLGEIRTRNQYPTVKEDAKLIAWKCLEKHYNAQPVDKTSVLTELKKDNTEDSLNNARACLVYFENTLHLIKSIGYSNEQIRFTLDPLAEYLAGLYLIKHYSDKEQLWRDFLTEARNKSQQEIKGFLLALRECSLTKSVAVKIPDFVAEDLGKLVGINLEAEKQQKLKQNISYLIKQLKALKLKDKLRAVKQLQKMAATDQYALDGLLMALEIDDITVRGDAARALGNLGNTSTEVLDKLLLRLKDDELNVRSNILVALGKLCNNLPSPSVNLVDELLTILKDKDESASLHENALKALVNLGDVSNQVLKELLLCLQDKDYDFNVRQAAAEALGKFGKVFDGLFDGLLSCLEEKNDDANVRQATAEALGKLGKLGKLDKDVEEILSRLSAVVENKHNDFNVLQAAEEALEVLKKFNNSPENI
ncbi:HEAT repeat domain-containing protein [Nostoc sp. PA-18-2419]|uniref:HEAT repeat domain-containing protein n=1 Tax=Nostoc sp. PA-18-2419 TaxID=2575443 RepID=UPI001108C743|nr:HEAT repeat domain-containing protein [Nostoc sp. PA-18-2419]